MSELNPAASEDALDLSQRPLASDATLGADANGSAVSEAVAAAAPVSADPASVDSPPPPGADAAPAEHPRVKQAEDMVDRLAAGVSSATHRWGSRFARVLARVREVGQDFWAEVQSVRRGDQP